jgi:hypothetical protein
MQVQNKALSLFDFIGNANKADSSLEHAIAKQKASTNMANEIRELQSDISSDKVDDTLARLNNGDSNLSLQTIDNMLNFKMMSVSEDLQQVAADLGINSEVQISHIDGQWHVKGASDNNRSLQQLQNYLDRNAGLQSKLDTVNQLSEMVELGQSQEFAKQLQAADVSEPDIVTYLTQAREYLFSIDSFNLSSKKVSLVSRGEAQNFFVEVKQTLGLSEANP